MNLMLSALLTDLHEMALMKGIKRFRINHNRNARGDLVIALIVEDREGPLAPDRAPR